MYDDRQFCQNYDLYRPTWGVDETGENVLDDDTLTTADLPCLFQPKGQQAAFNFKSDSDGLDIDFDAILKIPASQTLNPKGKGVNPDHVEFGGVRYVVMAVWDSGGQGLFWTVKLKERE